MILHNGWAELAVIAAAVGIVVALVLWYVAVRRPRTRQGARFPIHTLPDGTAYVGDEPPPDELVDAFADLRDSVRAPDDPDRPVAEAGAGRHRYSALTRGQRRPIGYERRR